MSGNARVFEKLEQLKSKEKKIAFLKRHAEECQMNIIAAAPRDTGAYIASIKVSDVQEEPDGLSISVYTDLSSGWNGKKLAEFLEHGTGIFRDDGTGRQTPWVYYNERWQRFVFTRGQIARPHWRPAYEIQKMKIKEELRSGRLW